MEYQDTLFEPVLRNGTLILGQEQDDFAGGFDFKQSYSGSISQVGFWDRVLSEEEIAAMANCNIVEAEGNLIPWNQAHYRLVNVITTDVPLGHLCKEEEHSLAGKLIVKDKVSYDDLKPVCDILGGRIDVVHNPTEVVEIHDKAFNIYKLLDDTEKCYVDPETVNLVLANVYKNGTWIDVYEPTKKVTGLEDLMPYYNNGLCTYIWGNHGIESMKCWSR